MSNTKKFAERELDILVKSCPDPENPAIIAEFVPEILSLVDKFGRSGQSGGSAPYVATAITQALKKLLLQEPLCPIMGTDDEWQDISEEMGGKSGEIWQNRRCYALFKDASGVVYYSDAIIKMTPDGINFNGSFWLSKEDYLTGNEDLMISSSQKIKGFPFTPKTFYVDVIEEEVAKDDFEMYLKDVKQLDEVFDYYERG